MITKTVAKIRSKESFILKFNDVNYLVSDDSVKTDEVLFVSNIEVKYFAFEKYGVLQNPNIINALNDLLNIAEVETTLVYKEVNSDTYDVSLEDIVVYKKANDKLVELSSNVSLQTKFADFMCYCFIDVLTKQEHLALVYGEINNTMLCRIHSECLTGDVFGSRHCDCQLQLHTAMERIVANGSGVLLYMRQEGRGIGLVDKLLAYDLQRKGYDTVDANLILGHKSEEREFYLCAQMLKYLGISSLDILTNNPLKISNLETYGIEINSRLSIEIEKNGIDDLYLDTKVKKMGHLINN